ncbi:MAG: macro domain-containing protein [Gemmatimonadales bacterium]|nr:macro domain-containing protein [Gemmatimonadales bacterium]
MISVVLDDLAFVEVDAVIRPADERLSPVTPVGTRLDAQAGPTFAAQRRVATPLQNGTAVVTGGGDLTAPFVLHVVIREDGVAASGDLIRRALVSAWQRAGDWGLTTIAAPLVGAGAGQLGVEESAALMADTFAAPGRLALPSELQIVVEHEAERAMVDAVIRSRT